MKTMLPPQVRRQALTIIFVFVFSLGSFGQSRLAATYDPALPGEHDLNSSLAELTRVAPATNQDLTSLHVSAGKIRRLEFWRRDSAHKAQIAVALRRNLQFAVPTLVRDTQASHGSISTTFKLYNDLSVVCESLDSLVSPGSRGNKEEYAALARDLSDLDRIREELSSHIQHTAALLESGNPSLVLSAGRAPKKIIVDDAVPEKRTLRKKIPPQ
ncbi:MAG TPA: hypothetical protein VKY85_09835 [Candidatus Angelobacter sp.]|nr:hypothetical protein [Candidatus Angelobacter sp.]